MAAIYVKGLREPVFVSDERAKKIKADWMEKSNTENVVDLGEWCGTFGQIKSIHIELPREARYSDYEGEDYRLGPDEQKKADAARDRISAWMKKRASKDGKNVSYMNPQSNQYDGIVDTGR